MDSTNSAHYRALGLLNSYLDESSLGIEESTPSVTGNDSSPRSASQYASVTGKGFTAWLDERVGSRKLQESTAVLYRKWVSAYLAEIDHPAVNEVRSWIPPARRLRLEREASERAEQALLAADADASALFVSSSTRNKRYLSFASAKVIQLLADALMPQSSSASDSLPTASQVAKADTCMWFMCTLWTGLRPLEWPYARYLQNHFDPDTGNTRKSVLEVRSLKQKGRREDNPLKDKRYLVLDAWPDHQTEFLRAFLDAAHNAEDAGNFGKFYDNCRKVLARTWKRLLVKHGRNIQHLVAPIRRENENALRDLARSTSSPALMEGNSLSLYTARHTFAEECRRDGRISQYQIAALLGHSMITNQAYYGLRRENLPREHTFCLPSAWPGDAEAIELWDRTVNPQRDRYMSIEDRAKAALDVESVNRDRFEADGVSSRYRGL